MARSLIVFGFVVVLVALAFFALPFFTGYLALGANASTSKTIVVGAILPLTGNAALVGEEARQGIELALSESDYNVSVIFEDSQNDAKTSVTVAQKLISFDGANALISWRSAPSSAIAPIANDNNIVLLYGSAIVEPAKKFPFVFKDHLDINKDCSLLAKTLAGKKGAILGANNDSTLSCIESFEASGFVLQEELYQKSETDFRSRLSKISASKPNFIIIRTFSDEISTIFKQMSELGIGNTIIVCPTIKGIYCDDPKLIGEFPGLLQGAVGTDFVLDERNSETKLFVQTFEKKFGKKPGTEAAFAFESMKILLQAAKPCIGETAISECLKENLLSKEFDGIDGKKRFDSFGIISPMASLLKFDGNNWVVVEALQK